MLYLRPLVITVCLLCYCHLTIAQTTDSAKVNPTKLTTPTVEEVDGVLAVAGHFGKKMLREVGEKLNMVDEAPNERKKVVMKVGPFRIERYE